MNREEWLTLFSTPGILLTLLENSSDIVFLIHGDRFVWVSNPGETYLGLTKEEVMEKRIHSFLSERVLDALSSLTDTETSLSLTMKDDHGRSLIMELAHFSSKEGPLYLVVAKEMTSQQRISLALAESKKNYQEIVESMEDGYYEVDLRGNFTYLNQALCRILGFSLEEGLGMNYRQFYQNPDKVFEAYNRVYRTGKPHQGFGWTIINSKGEERFVEVSIALIRDEYGNPKGFSGVARDISERKKTEQTLRYLSTKDTLTGLFNRYYFEEEMKRLQQIDINEVTIFVFDIDGLKFINDTLGHHLGDELLKASASILESSFRTSDVLARIGGDEFAAIFPSYSTGLIKRIERTLKKKIARHNYSHPHLPISLSIGVYGTTGKDLDLNDILRFADDEMYRKKNENKMQVKQMILDHFLSSLKKKDFVSKGHRDRVQKISLVLGHQMGLSSSQCELLSLLAHYHDLGKVAIPDSILFKNEPLTQGEFESMKRHVETGYRIISHFPHLKILGPSVLDHHQWWNGQGYPGSKKGEAIDFLSRIFLVADAMDSMTGFRPYRDPIPVLQAVKIIQQGAGKQFDPQVVKSLIVCMESSLLQLEP